MKKFFQCLSAPDLRIFPAFTDVQGTYDVIAKAKYAVPDYWDIGEVFERLIEDTCGNVSPVEGIKEVFSSWIAEKILNFNSDLYYQSRDYLAECYRAGEIVAA